MSNFTLKLEHSMKLTMTTVEARENFAEVVNQAAYGNQRVILTRRGKPLVAVVSLEELKSLEQSKNISKEVVAELFE
jgi:prevent-host-death family protein